MNKPKNTNETDILITDRLPLMIAFLDKELKYKFMNQLFHDWVGVNVSLESQIGSGRDKKLYNILRPFIEEVLNGQDQETELLLPPDGDRPYQILNIKILNDSSKFFGSGFLLIIQDITQLKNSAAIAIEKEKTLSVLLNHLSLGVVLHDSKGKIMEFNSSALRILGVSKEQLLGKTSYDPYWKVIDENSEPLSGSKHPAAVSLATGLPVHNQIMGIVTKENQVTWISTSSTPIFQGQDLQPSQVLVTFEDKTKKVQLEKELRMKSFWTEAIFNGTHYSMISTLPDGNIQTFNKRAEELLGYKSSELVNQKTVDMFHESSEIVQRAKELSAEFGQEIKPGFDVFIKKALINGHDTHTWTYIKKNGERLKVRLCVTAILDEKKNCIGYLGVAEEI
nr:hypothetical protein BHI3_27320 [Bacteriovorax sp. HI3]